MKRILAFGFSVALLLALAACAEKPTTQSPEKETTPPSYSQSITPTPEPTLEPTPEPVAALAVGDNVDMGDWNVSVTGFEFTSRIDNGYSYFSPDEGNQYALVSMTVTNNGKQSSSFLPSFSIGDDIRAKLLYNIDYEYSSVQLLAYDKDLHDASMNPLTTKDGCIAFEVPAAVVDGTESLTISFTLGSEEVAFTLR